MQLHQRRPVFVLALASLSTVAAAQTTTRVSVSSAGVQGNQDSRRPALSADGRFAVFRSNASNLGPGLVVRDRLLGTCEIIPGAANTSSAVVSSDARFIAFATQDALIPVDTNVSTDVYVLDRLLATFDRVTLSDAGAQISQGGFSPAMSADARFVAFTSFDPSVVSGVSGRQLYVRDRQAATTRLVSASSAGVPSDPNGDSNDTPSISGDGRFIVFRTANDNLVPGDVNQSSDLFIRDNFAGTTECISVDPSGAPAGSYTPVGLSVSALSRDGRFVAFASGSSILVLNDTNNSLDIFVRDRLVGSTVRVSIDSFGLEGNADSTAPAISDDGSRVAFTSLATNLALNDTNATGDVFVHETSSGRTTRVSVTSGGLQSNGASIEPAICRDGSSVGFTSSASNMVEGDTNNRDDVFVHEPDLCPPPLRYCAAKLNSLGCLPVIDSTGTPSTTILSGFVINCANVRNNKPGLLLYSITGRNDVPFQGGRLCIASTIRRTPGVNSGGNPPPSDCSGVYSIDFATFSAGQLGGQPLFDLKIPGTKVNVQWWGRDPGYPAPLDTTLSDGLEFFMCP